MNLVITCKTGYEKILSRELALYQLTPQTEGPGWVVALNDAKKNTVDLDQLSQACFPQFIFANPTVVSAPSVNALVEKLLEVFTAHIGETRIENPWSFSFIAGDEEQAARRAKTVEKEWCAKLAKLMSRVAKLSRPGIPIADTFVPGFFVCFTDFEHAYVSFQALSGGQQRMHMDQQSPSRSYLKIEEAFHILGCEPQANETVVDLGGAPGGWSYSALKRGARVIAVDNGPLKEPVKSHPLIRHQKTDALKFNLAHAKPVDWLFCDIIEKPDIVFNLLHRWVHQKWCRRFIVNLKIGRADPIPILKKINDTNHGLALFCRRLKTRQLYHDREEITVMGERD